jgi:hypothetical protein
VDQRSQRWLGDPRRKLSRRVKNISQRKGAIAARKLPSDDVIITFQDTGTKKWHTKNGGWIETAFGETAKEARRTFAVLVKGMLKRDLKDVTESVFGKELGLSSVDKVRFRIPTIEGVTRATALVALTIQDEARNVCEEWIVSRAGEAQCPTQGNTVPLRCLSCTGKHPAWVRWCPEAVKARGAAREAYHSGHGPLSSLHNNSNNNNKGNSHNLRYSTRFRVCPPWRKLVTAFKKQPLVWSQSKNRL